MTCKPFFRTHFSIAPYDGAKEDSMNNKQLFQRYYGKLAWEGWLKSFIWGFDAGCIVFALLTFIGWAVGLNLMIWVAIGIGVAVTAAVTVILYLRLYRPTTAAIARRLDQLGLEERMITMAELEKNDSFIAMRQREDASAKLASLNPKSVKISPFAGRTSETSPAVVTASVVSPLVAAAVCVVFILSAVGILPPGNLIFNPPAPAEYVNVHYLVDDGGVVEGVTEQTVQVGGTTETVLAVADDGYMFVQWSDGVTEPSRSDSNVQEEIFVFAQFMEVGEDEDIDEGDDPGDQPPDVPGGDSQNRPGDPDDPNDPTDNPPTVDENGDVIDGKTDYSDVYESYYDWLMEEIASGKLQLTDELRKLLEDYYNSLL